MQKPCVRTRVFHGSGKRHEQKQKREEKIGNSENGNRKQRKSDKSVHNEIQISMHTWRSRMSDAPQGAFVVIPEISYSDIPYILKKIGSRNEYD